MEDCRKEHKVFGTKHKATHQTKINNIINYIHSLICMWLAEDERERFSSPITFLSTKWDYSQNKYQWNVLGIMQSLSTIWIYMMQAILVN